MLIIAFRNASANAPARSMERRSFVTMNFGILVLLLALILFGVLAFLQLSALILAPLVSVFVIVCSSFPAALLPVGLESV